MGRRQRRSVMSEQLKNELAKDLGFYDTVQKEGWGGIRAKDAGNMVKRAIQLAEQAAAKQTVQPQPAANVQPGGFAQPIGASPVRPTAYAPLTQPVQPTVTPSRPVIQAQPPAAPRHAAGASAFRETAGFGQQPLAAGVGRQARYDHQTGAQTAGAHGVQPVSYMQQPQIARSTSEYQ
jgi:small acid-soluble spore protein F (minor alpha/beta-type SASP)